MMSPTKVIIVDDEPLVRERIISLLETRDHYLVLKECSNSKDAIEAITNLKPNVVFLDIQMPGGSGFKVLDELDFKPVIIFITAFEKYAIKAFEYAAFDYVVKPISADRFFKTLNRLEESLNSLPRSTPPQMTLQKEGVYFKINVSEISHIEASDNYVRIYSGSDIYRKRSTLRAISDQLQSAGFIQVHRSFIVNERHIREVAKFKQGDFLVRLSNGRIIPTSKSYRDTIRKWHRS